LIEQLAEKQNQPIAISTKKLVSDLKNAIWGNDRQELQLKLDPTMQTEVDLRNQRETRNLALSAGASNSEHSRNRYKSIV
jgi:hypothetical protein